eukprot:scaffold227404_cov17-Prasinocladus_malaysianus.AAC.1
MGGVVPPGTTKFERRQVRQHSSIPSGHKMVGVQLRLLCGLFVLTHDHLPVPRLHPWCPSGSTQTNALSAMSARLSALMLQFVHSSPPLRSLSMLPKATTRNRQDSRLPFTPPTQIHNSDAHA